MKEIKGNMGIHQVYAIDVEVKIIGNKLVVRLVTLWNYISNP